MNFCGTRIKTISSESKPTKKLMPLQVREGMWACEKRAVETHNEQVELQNQECVLASLKMLDMSFLGKLDKDGNPKFGVFPIESFVCRLEIRLGYQGKFESLSCGLPKIIGNGYRSGLKNKKLGQGRRYYGLVANFVGLVPPKTKKKIVALKRAGVKTYLIAETSWEKKEIPKPDPLVVAVFNSKAYLVDKFDASIEENYVAKEFSQDPPKASLND